MDKLKSIYASAYSATISIIVTVIVTIGMEFSYPPKAWLAGFTGHHWITKSWLAIIVFVLFFAIFWFAKKDVSAEQTERSISVLNLTAVFGFLAILLFFIYEFFAH